MRAARVSWPTSGRFMEFKRTSSASNICWLSGRGGALSKDCQEMLQRVGLESRLSSSWHCCGRVQSGNNVKISTYSHQFIAFQLGRKDIRELLEGVWHRLLSSEGEDAEEETHEQDKEGELKVEEEEELAADEVICFEKNMFFFCCMFACFDYFFVKGWRRPWCPVCPRGGHGKAGGGGGRPEEGWACQEEEEAKEKGLSSFWCWSVPLDIVFLSWYLICRCRLLCS